jgi:hypothetical protein
VGFLDRAKKLAEQAKEMANEAVDKVKEQQAASKASSSAPASSGSSSSSAPGSAGYGTPAGEVGERWKSLGLADPAGVLPPKTRAAHGIPTSTKSAVVAEAWGVGRRWSAGDRSVGLLYLIDSGSPPASADATGERWTAARPADAETVADVGDGAYAAPAGDGREGVYVRAGAIGFVVEFAGIDRADAAAMARVAAGQLA